MHSFWIVLALCSAPCSLRHSNCKVKRSASPAFVPMTLISKQIDSVSMWRYTIHSHVCKIVVVHMNIIVSFLPLYRKYINNSRARERGYKPIFMEVGKCLSLLTGKLCCPLSTHTWWYLVDSLTFLINFQPWRKCLLNAYSNSF